MTSDSTTREKDVRSRAGLTATRDLRFRILLSGNVISAVGSGMVQPFLVIYLTRARGLPNAIAATSLTAVSLGALLGAGLAGFLIDRFSLRLAGLSFLTAASLSTSAFCLVSTVLASYTVAACFGVGVGGTSVIWSAAVARHVKPRVRTMAYGLQFSAINAGMAMGGILGSLIVSHNDAWTFQILYLSDGGSYLAAGLAFFFLTSTKISRHESRSADVSENDRVRTVVDRGYRAIIRDYAILPILALTVMFYTFGYGQYQSSLPIIVTGAGIAPSAIGVAYVVNALAVVAGYFLLAAWRASIEATTMLLLAGLAWTATWLIIAGCIVINAGYIKLIFLLIALAIFGVGETLIASALPSLVNQRSPRQTQGLYNAVYSWSMSLGFILGPLFASPFIVRDSLLHLTATLGLCCGCTATLSYFLKLRLPATASPRRHPDAPLRDRGVS